MPDTRRWRVAPVAGFTTLSLDVFLGGPPASVNVYAIAGDDPTPRLVAGRTTRVDPEQLMDWKAEGLRGLMVRDSDLPALVQRVESSLDSILGDADLSHAERYRVLQWVACATLGERLRRADTDQWIRESQRVAERIANLLVGSGASIESIIDLAAHDATSLVHATNTAAYAALLADAMGDYSEEEIRQIALGALLHDCGMRLVPREILDKRGPLSERDERVIESHTTRGYEALLGQPGVSVGHLMMAYQHHEWVNGGGYPVGIEGDEIHPWARIMAVVDVFDELTATRPNREAVSTGKAVLKITAGVGKQFDVKVVRCWISIFEQKSRTRPGPHSRTASTMSA